MNRSTSSRLSSQGSASSQSQQPHPLEEHEIQSMRSRVIHSGRTVTLPEPEYSNLINNNSISKYQGFIIYCIVENRKLNLSYIMLKYIGDMINNKSMGLGYGGILCTIFSILGIEINNDNPTRSRLPISQRTLNLRNAHPFFDREEDSQQQEYEQHQQYYERQQQFYEPQQHPNQQEEQQQQQELQQQQFLEPSRPIYNPLTQEFSLDQLGEDLSYDLYNNYRFL